MAVLPRKPGLQQRAIPGGRRLVAKELAPHVVIDGDHIEAQLTEMLHGLGTDEPRRTSHDNYRHTCSPIDVLWPNDESSAPVIPRRTQSFARYHSREQNVKTPEYPN